MYHCYADEIVLMKVLNVNAFERKISLQLTYLEQIIPEDAFTIKYLHLWVLHESFKKENDSGIIYKNSTVLNILIIF